MLACTDRACLPGSGAQQQRAGPQRRRAIAAAATQQWQRQQGAACASSDGAAQRQQQQRAAQRALTPQLPCQRWGLRRAARRPLQGSEPAQPNRHTAPEVPMPGDDQASTIYTALATGSYDEEAYEEALAKEEDAHRGDNGSGAAAAGQQQQQEPAPVFGVPHRWQVVGMMALSFVSGSGGRGGVRGDACRCTHCRWSAVLPVRLCQQQGQMRWAGQPRSHARRRWQQALMCAARPALRAAAGAVQHGQGEHVGGGDPHGQGAGLERHGARPRVLRILLGIFPDPGPGRLGLHQVLLGSLLGLAGWQLLGGHPEKHSVSTGVGWVAVVGWAPE